MRRSDFFHGRSEAGSEHLGNHLEQSSLHALGQEAVKLCARIVLSMAQREGVAVPGRAKVNFGVRLAMPDRGRSSEDRPWIGVRKGHDGARLVAESPSPHGPNTPLFGSVV